MNYEIPETMKAWVLGRYLEYLRWKRETGSTFKKSEVIAIR